MFIDLPDGGFNRACVKGILDDEPSRRAGDESTHSGLLVGTKRHFRRPNKTPLTGWRVVYVRCLEPAARESSEGSTYLKFASRLKKSAEHQAILDWLSAFAGRQCDCESRCCTVDRIGKVEPRHSKDSDADVKMSRSM